MKRAILAAAAAVLPLAFASCDKDVYVAGIEIVEDPKNDGESYDRSLTYGGGLPVAAVWKNGALLHRLGDGVHWSGAWSVFVSGGDVYVAGTVSDGWLDPTVPTVWKNGGALPHRLGDGKSGSNAKSIHVSGKDVYVEGSDSESRKVWKNAVEHSRGVLAFHASGRDVYAAIDENAEKREKARKAGNWGEIPNIVVVQKNGITLHRLGDVEVASIWASGEDVYAAGAEKTGQRRGLMAATVWKNGAALRLGDGKSDSGAHSVYASGKDVYVVGYERGVVAWKNGVAIQRVGLDEYEGLESASVRASGGDVYVQASTADESGMTQRVWKNGAVLPGAEAFCVSGGDVYMAGHDGDDALTIWKNGKVKHRLPKGEPRASVMAVFVE
jgi:hypothetical protein